MTNAELALHLSCDCYQAKGVPEDVARAELASQINNAAGWQEFHQGIRPHTLMKKPPNWEMYKYWTEQYNRLRSEYRKRYNNKQEALWPTKKY